MYSGETKTKVFNLLSTLTMEHGGLTRASLRRGRALQQLGYDVSILTYNLVPNFPEIEDHVREYSELGSLPVLRLIRFGSVVGV